jgi:hypothetical protein
MSVRPSVCPPRGFSLGRSLSELPEEPDQAARPTQHSWQLAFQPGSLPWLERLQPEGCSVAVVLPYPSPNPPLPPPEPVHLRPACCEEEMERAVPAATTACGVGPAAQCVELSAWWKAEIEWTGSGSQCLPYAPGRF